MLIGAGYTFVEANASKNMETLEGVLISLKRQPTAVWKRMLHIISRMALTPIQLLN